VSDKLYEEFLEWVKQKKREGYDDCDIKEVVLEWKDFIAYRDW
jgi:hypothetical protein